MYNYIYAYACHVSSIMHIILPKSPSDIRSHPHTVLRRIFTHRMHFYTLQCVAACVHMYIYIDISSGQEALLPFLLKLATKDTHDPVATPCCTAQDAWDGLVAAGGCGGSGPSEADCSAAMELCRDCQAAVQYYARNATALSASDVRVDISSAKVTCELPQWDPHACTGTVKGLGVGLLIATGVSLLLVASMACVAFDWRLLPSLVAWQRRKLLVEAITVQNKIHAELECASPSAPLPPKPVPPAPPTPTARPQGFSNPQASASSLRTAGFEQLTLAAASPTSPAVSAIGQCSSPAALAALAALTAPAPPGEEPKILQRPRHYASAYALHTAFLVIACMAVVLRVSYVVARGLVLGLRLAHQCLPELLLCILPLAWVALTSRRPKSSTAAVPMSVAYWGPWQAIPRFTTYAVCTICSEIYSTLVAALAVARLPCTWASEHSSFYVSSMCKR